MTRRAARNRRDGPAGTASENDPFAPVTAVALTTDGEPLRRSLLSRLTTTPAPEPATVPVTVVRRTRA